MPPAIACPYACALQISLCCCAAERAIRQARGGPVHLLFPRRMHMLSTHSTQNSRPALPQHPSQLLTAPRCWRPQSCRKWPPPGRPPRRRRPARPPGAPRRSATPRSPCLPRRVWEVRSGFVVVRMEEQAAARRAAHTAQSRKQQQQRRKIGFNADQGSAKSGRRCGGPGLGMGSARGPSRRPTPGCRRC